MSTQQTASSAADESQAMFNRAAAAAGIARKILAAMKTLEDAGTLTAGTARAGFTRFQELTEEAQGLIAELESRTAQRKGVDR